VKRLMRGRLSGISAFAIDWRTGQEFYPGQFM
jgi:hypothetical protein